MVRDLQVQDVLYGKESLEQFAKSLMPMYADEGDTIEDMIACLKEPSTIESLKEVRVLNDLQYIDLETYTLWSTKELYDKHMQYIKRKHTEKTPLQQKEEELSSLEAEAKKISEAEALIDQQKESQEMGDE